MNQPLISICIPTFNRAHTLSNLLASIENDIINFDINFLEIVISDNASTDNTSSVVKYYVDRGLPIKYCRLDSNKGYGINMNNAISIASGFYCWLMGSDETVLPGVLVKLHSIIKSSEGNVDIIIGDSMTNGNHRHFLDGRLHEYLIHNIESLCDYIDSCNEISSLFAFISVLIIKKEFWNGIELNTDMIEHPYTHQLRIIQLIKISVNGTRVLYFNHPIVFTGREKNEWNENVYKHFHLDCETLRYISEQIYFSDCNLTKSISALIEKQYSWFRICLSRSLMTVVEWNELVRHLYYFNINPRLLKRNRCDFFLRLVYTMALKIKKHVKLL